jgi:DNA polymerase-3 subunit delta
MLLALIGLDEFAKEERIAKFREESVKNSLPFKVFFASSPKENVSFTAEIASALAASFFEPAASVLARHCEFLPADELRRLADFINGGAQGNLLLDFAELDKRSALWKLLEKSKAVEIYEPPSKYQKWIESHAQRHFKKRISPQAAQYIADAVGNDTKRIHSEIKKIFLYSPDIQEINIQHCQLFIWQDREVPAYELRDSFGFRDIRVFLPKFRRILAEEGDAAFMPIVAALRSHALNLLHIQTMRAKKIPDYDISARILPPRQAFLYQKNRLPEQSARWGSAALQKAILRLDELSYGKKMGFYGDLPSFELAICGLLL